MLIPVLMYHDIKPDEFDLSAALPENRPYIQKLSQFVEQVNYIKKKGFLSLTVSDLYRERTNDIANSAGASNKKIILSFDDGDQSNYDYAFKTLIKHNLKATFFITTDYVGKSDRINWQQLKEMHAAGMEIGSHTVSHPVPSQLTYHQLEYEMVESKKIIEDAIEAEISSFSLPTGFYNSNVVKIAQKANYFSICTSFVGMVNTANINHLNMKRIAIKRSTNFTEFVDYIEGNQSRLYKKILIEKIKNSSKKILGINGYNRIRNYFLKGRV